MPWKHEGHEIWMMVQYPNKEHSGPYCVDCDEGMFYFVPPTEKEMKKAQEWVEANKERLEL